MENWLTRASTLACRRIEKVVGGGRGGSRAGSGAFLSTTTTCTSTVVVARRLHVYIVHAHAHVVVRVISYSSTVLSGVLLYCIQKMGVAVTDPVL